MRVENEIVDAAEQKFRRIFNNLREYWSFYGSKICYCVKHEDVWIKSCKDYEDWKTFYSWISKHKNIRQAFIAIGGEVVEFVFDMGVLMWLKAKIKKIMHALCLLRR